MQQAGRLSQRVIFLDGVEKEIQILLQKSKPKV